MARPRRRPSVTNDCAGVPATGEEAATPRSGQRDPAPADDSTHRRLLPAAHARAQPVARIGAPCARGPTRRAGLGGALGVVARESGRHSFATQDAPARDPAATDQRHPSAAGGCRGAGPRLRHPPQAPRRDGCPPGRGLWPSLERRRPRRRYRGDLPIGCVDPGRHRRQGHQDPSRATLPPRSCLRAGVFALVTGHGDWSSITTPMSSGRLAKASSS